MSLAVPTTKHGASRSKSGHREGRWALDAAQRLCKAAGVPYCTPQGLRGTNATLADLAGTAPLDVARSLGHADVRTTAKHYSRAREESRRRRGREVIRGGAR